MSYGFIFLWVQSYAPCLLVLEAGGHQCPVESFFYGSRVMPPVYILLWFQSYVPCFLVLEAGGRGASMSYGLILLWFQGFVPCLYSSMVSELCPLFIFFYGSRVMPPVCLYLKHRGVASMSYGIILLWFQCYASCLLVPEVGAVMSYGQILLWFQSYAPFIFFYGSRVVPPVCLYLKQRGASVSYGFILLWFQSYAPCLF